MADPFVAEIRMVPFNFAPRGWAFCNGQVLPISQNTALFSLLGTTYGGDGRSTFALPDLQGRSPMHPGQGPGLSLYDLGEQGGTETVTLLQSELPSHSHAVNGQPEDVNSLSPANAYPGAIESTPMYRPLADGTSAMSPTPSGGDQPHNNRQPYLTMNFIIALQGVFPPRA
jgi:microcystin-dependent protein